MSDVERKAFERAFPVPAGIYWNDISEQYDALPGAAGFDDVEIYHGQWQAWQAARAQSGQGAEPVAFQVYWYENDCEFYESPLPSFGDDPQQIVPLYDHPQPTQQGSAPYGALIRLIEEEVKGPQGFATWREAAVSERMGRVAMKPREEVVELAREGLQVFTGPNMNERILCVELLRLADAYAVAATPQPEGDGNKRHWYALSYRGRDRESGCAADAVTYTGYPENALTMARIQAAKADAGVDDKAVLVCATYLGHMTKEEFTTQQEAPDDE